VSPAVLKVCGSHADFASQYSNSWVEDRRQQLCCAPRAEGQGSHFGVWHFVAPEECVDRYAPGLPLPYYYTPDSATPGVETSQAKHCLPGVAVQIFIPTPEFEARLASSTRLRIESCIGPNCAEAVVDFDDLAHHDQLLFALEGSSQAGAFLTWDAAMLRLKLRIVQPREQVVDGERYRLTLELEGKSLRAVDTALAYDSSGAVPAPGFLGSTSSPCPVALVTVGTP